MHLARTALALAATMLIACGTTFAGDDDAKAKRDRIMSDLEKMLQSERDNVRKHVEKIVDDELAKGARKTAPKEEKNGARPFIGLYLEDAQTEMGGAVVREVVEGSPAAKAGVKAGDTIVKMNGAQMGASKDVIAAVGKKNPGDEVKLDIVRGKESLSVSLKLGTRPAEAAASFPGSGDDDDEKADEGKKDEGKKSPSADDLRARIKKFMDKMNGPKDDEKEAKKEPKKNAKDLLDQALKGDKKGDKKGDAKKGDEDDDEEDKGDQKGMPDLKNMQKLLEGLLKGQKGGGDEGEEKGDGQDDPMAGIMKWLQSEEAQKLLEQLQPMIEKLMQDENFQKLLEQLQQGGGLTPDQGDEKEEQPAKPPKKEEKPAKQEKLAAAYLGLSPTELSDDLREQLDVKGGVVVGDVVADGPAAKAGLKKNDVITAIDGTEINGPADVRSILAKHKPGDSVELSVLRKGKKKTINVELGRKGAMAPSNEGDRRKAALPGAAQDLSQSLRIVPQGQQPGDPAKWIQQMGQFAKTWAGKQELYWNVTDKNGKVLWKQRLEPEKMIELGARLGESEAEHAAKNPRAELPRIGKDLADALRQQAEERLKNGDLTAPRLAQQLRDTLRKALQKGIEKAGDGCGQ